MRPEVGSPASFSELSDIFQNTPIFKKGKRIAFHEKLREFSQG
jgi:hypothetical protein